MLEIFPLFDHLQYVQNKNRHHGGKHCDWFTQHARSKHTEGRKGVKRYTLNGPDEWVSSLVAGCMIDQKNTKLYRTRWSYRTSGVWIKVWIFYDWELNSVHFHTQATSIKIYCPLKLIVKLDQITSGFWGVKSFRWVPLGVKPLQYLSIWLKLAQCKPGKDWRWIFKYKCKKKGVFWFVFKAVNMISQYKTVYNDVIYYILVARWPHTYRVKGSCPPGGFPLVTPVSSHSPKTRRLGLLAFSNCL